MMVATTNEIAGYRVVRRLAMVREEAYRLMVQHAEQTGANAVIGMRYDATEIMEGITEVLAYGAAVVVKPA